MISNRPTLLLEHHFKELILPSFLREYGKLASQCAAEGVSHPDYLLRLAELEVTDRHQRTVQRRIRAARQRRLSVGFTAAAALVNELLEARDQRRLLNLQRQLARLRLLIIDELGFVPLSPTGTELLFEVFSQRYERGSILFTTNLPFDE